MSPPPRSPLTLARFLLVAFPLGLVISILVALWLYYERTTKPDNQSRGFAQVARAKELSLQELNTLKRVLSNDLGLCSLAEPTALKRTAQWIGSTLGPRNAGAKTQIIETTIADQTVPHVMVEWIKSINTGPTLIVAVPYDCPISTPSEARRRDERVATFISIVQSTIDASWAHSLKLLFFAASGRDEGGRPAVLATLKLRGINPAAWLEIQSATWSPLVKLPADFPALTSLKTSPPLGSSTEGFFFFAPPTHQTWAVKFLTQYTQNTTLPAYQILSEDSSSLTPLPPSADLPTAYIHDLTSWFPGENFSTTHDDQTWLQTSISLERLIRTLGQEGF